MSPRTSVCKRPDPEVLTVMFVDIEGFCHISETVSPQDLVAVCMEYFESMCSVPEPI